jgi:ceramide synthetase
MKKASDFLFPLFAVVWIVTRLGIYPAYILNSTLYEAPKLMTMFPATNFLNGMLLLLLCLHIFWTWFIVKAVARAVTTAKIGGDARSSTDELSDSDVSLSTTPLRMTTTEALIR